MPMFEVVAGQSSSNRGLDLDPSQDQDMRPVPKSNLELLLTIL